MSAETERQRLRDAFAKHGLIAERKPTAAQMRAANQVLAWLSADCGDGALRDQIGAVRHAIYERLPQ